MQSETVRVGKPFDNLLEHRGWKVYNIHGNMYQAGLPDRYITHGTYSPRWVEYKIEGHSFTKAQRVVFPQLIAHNVPLYLIEGTDFRGIEGKDALHRAYKKLFGAPNCAYYLHSSNRRLKI